MGKLSTPSCNKYDTGLRLLESRSYLLYQLILKRYNEQWSQHKSQFLI